jgi:hypothetical protein
MARETLKNHPAAARPSGAVTARLESSQRAVNLLLQLRTTLCHPGNTLVVGMSSTLPLRSMPAKERGSESNDEAE